MMLRGKSSLPILSMSIRGRSKDWLTSGVVISILPRNREIDNPHINDYIKELNFALSQMVETLNYGVFLDVYDDFAYEDKMNMNYSLDGLHLNDLGYNILNVRLSKEL